MLRQRMKDLRLRACLLIRTSNENFNPSFGRLRQKVAPKSVPHVLDDCFSLFNQSYCRCEALPWWSSFLSLPNVPISAQSGDMQTPLKAGKGKRGKTHATHYEFCLSLIGRDFGARFFSFLPSFESFSFCCNLYRTVV